MSEDSSNISGVESVKFSNNNNSNNENNEDEIINKNSNPKKSNNALQPITTIISVEESVNSAKRKKEANEDLSKNKYRFNFRK